MTLCKQDVVTLEIQDRFNTVKTWVIKRTKCGHYFMNQKINACMFYSKFTRTTRYHLGQVLNFDNNQVTGWFKDNK